MCHQLLNISFWEKKKKKNLFFCKCLLISQDEIGPCMANKLRVGRIFVLLVPLVAPAVERYWGQWVGRSSAGNKAAGCQAGSNGPSRAVAAGQGMLQGSCGSPWHFMGQILMRRRHQCEKQRACRQYGGLNSPDLMGKDFLGGGSGQQGKKIEAE